MNFFDFRVGDILLLNGDDYLSKAISVVQSTISCDEKSFTHAALMLSGNVVIEAKFGKKNRVIFWSDIERNYNLEKSLRCRYKFSDLDPEFIHKIVERSRFYYLQPYGMNKFISDSPETKNEEGIICSQLIELIFNGVGISFKEYTSNVWPVDIYNYVSQNGNWQLKKLSEKQVLKDDDESDNILIQALKNNLEIDKYLIAQFERLPQTIAHLNAFEDLKEYVNGLLHNVKSHDDIEKLKKRLGERFGQINLNDIVYLIQNVLERLSETKDVQQLTLQQKKVYTNEVILQDLKKNLVAFSEVIFLFEKLYKKINEMIGSENLLIQKYVIDIDNIINKPDQIEINERNEKISLIQNRLVGLELVEESRIVIETFLIAIKAYDDSSILWENFKNEYGI